ncbi:MAG TPA: hypothetical protein VJN70_05990 [Gemmatimonadaceae bacterium]|nr:hypothetical protein [Gemmatimonadaceae bacterium]
MSIYEFSLFLGAAGLGIMGLSGFAHTIGSHHGAHAPHGGHHGGAARGGMRAGRGAGRGAGRAGGARALWALLSPRPLFSMLVGFGAVGLMLHPIVPGALLLPVAAAGGILFELGITRPLWNFLFRFESAPALTLETCIGDEARAATSFDAKGDGLVALELDGQMVQLLGTLHREDREAGVRVRAGDPVRIDEVDAERNRCIVRRV